MLDVRNNGGGLFPAGVEVARQWLARGDIVLIADSQGVRDSYEADGSPVEAAAPLAVLVNRGTASASEVPVPPAAPACCCSFIFYNRLYQDFAHRHPPMACTTLSGGLSRPSGQYAVISHLLEVFTALHNMSGPMQTNRSTCQSSSQPFGQERTRISLDMTDPPLHACAKQQVLAGALRDNGRATVAGERTFGKGLIQTVVELSDGSGVAVTVARYQTPAGTDINKVWPLCPSPTVEETSFRSSSSQLAYHVASLGVRDYNPTNTQNS